MLCWSTGMLAHLTSHNQNGPIPWSISNAMMNTFSLHARNLINFIYSRSKNKDYPTDIIIEDYFGDSNHNPIPDITPILEEALIKANKQAAHLSIDRIDYEKSGKEWFFVKIAKQIMEVLQIVVVSIPDSRISPKLKRKLLHDEFIIPQLEVKTKPNSHGIYHSFEMRATISENGTLILGRST